jgi:hypothetical protein
MASSVSFLQHHLIRIAATEAIVIANPINNHSESVGTVGTALRVAEAGPPGGTPVPVTCEVVFVIGPPVVACI